MINWHLETRLIKNLKDHPKNPRKLSKHDAEHLEKSIQRFGLIDKPIITQDGQIIGGHQRKRILKKLALTEVECWVPDRKLTDEEIDELNIRLNRTGEWDFDILANEFEIGDLMDWGFQPESLGIDISYVNEKFEKDEVKHEKCPLCGKKLKVKKMAKNDKNDHA